MKASTEYPKTPELDKLKSVKDKSQTIGEFIEEFLQRKGVILGKPHKHDSTCLGWDEERGRYNPSDTARCSFQTDEFEPLRYTTEKLLAEFFEIDLKKVDAERQLVLEYIRKQNP